ncbi:hypothetical protein A9Q84_17470 [Halobacteriovorax marinus]|uniref:histidine kinase n=1 Tax=Halobacteriovorax marinus TaxID=97084 RepID=A0A1Y5F9K3_9BACT|nr:hypothetical protein A9Q84_17470 [Halobacteriovorax marinus]
MSNSKLKKYFLKNYALSCLFFLLLGLFVAFVGYWTLSLNDKSLKRVYSFRLFSRAHFQVINANSKALYLMNQGVLLNDSEALEEGYSHLETSKGFILSLNSEMFLNDQMTTFDKFLDEYDDLITSYESLLDRDITTLDKALIKDLSKRIRSISKSFAFSESDFWRKRSSDFENIRVRNSIIQKVYWGVLTFFFIGIVVLVYSSYERSKLEIALEQQRVQNVSRSRLTALGQFSAGVAHEINNPLTVILWRLKSIKKKYEDSYELSIFSKDIDSIETNTKRIDKIIKGIKTLTANANEDAFEKVSVKSIKEQLDDILAPKVDLGNFKYTFTSNILDTETDMREVQIIQVLINLINNSIDAIETLDEKWIRIETNIEANFLIYSVTDSGMGINKDAQGLLFKLFYTTKSKNKKGTGIGLTLASQILKDHRGSLEYNPESKHTQFLIKLPINLEQSSLLVKASQEKELTT